MSALLEVSDLQISLDRAGQKVVAVDEVCFTLSAGEVMGLVGESGSGKSLTGLSLMGLLQPPLGVSGGACSRPIRESPVRLFPEPDSPTRPITSPADSVKLTSSTATTCCPPRCRLI